MSTVKEICDGVPQSLLDSPISDIHIAQIANVMTEWEELAPFLGLTPAEESEIVERYRGRFNLQKREALRKWKEKNGIRATNIRLIDIFCTQGRTSLAQTLKDLLLSSENQSKSFSSVIEVFRNYLHDCYSDLPHPSSLQWPALSSNQSYVELELIDAPVKDNSADMSEHCKPIPLKFLFSAGNSKAKRKVILVEGVAGVGKTTISWHTCKEWAAGRLFENMKLLMHVSLSDPSIHSAKTVTLADLIPHPSEEMRRNVAKAIADIRGKGVCFLLEGCDEAPPPLWEKFLYRFVAGTGGRSMLPDAHIILTSRPGIPFQLTKCLTGKVIISGFHSLDDFLDKCSMKNKTQLLEALKMKPELYSLCHLPLNAVILTHLCDSECLKDHLPTTRTGLFYPLVRNFLVRHMETRTSYDTVCIDKLPTDLPDDLHSSLNGVSKLAYRSILQRKKVVDQEMLTEFGLASIDNAFGFLQVHLRLTMCGPTKQFSFIHLSLQEFLAAFHISQMDEVQQVAAVKIVFDQNPLSPVLAFYAGISRLVISEVQDMLFKVFTSPFDEVIGSDSPNSFYKATHLRYQCLGVMNCIYETQNPNLFTHVKLFVSDIGDVIMEQSHVSKTNEEGASRLKNAIIPLTCMSLYPSDCLSIGYFARYVSSRMKNRAYLDLSCSLLGDMEMKALAQEMHKSSSKNNVLLNVNGVHISTNALHSLRKLFNPRSCLDGLDINGSLIEDIQIAMKYFIEGLSRSCCQHLSLYNCSSKIIHYLVLLLRSPCKLTNLNLSYSSNLFTSPSVMQLFSEALKYTTLGRLNLEDCGIDDGSLKLLAAAVCHKHCELAILEIDLNPYTDCGLTHFLTLLMSVPFVRLAVLSVNHASDEHKKLVDLINESDIRRQHNCHPKLFIDSTKKLYSQDERVLEKSRGLILLQMRPDLSLRHPHH